jgi:sulfur-oxidizing protein SoxX
MARFGPRARRFVTLLCGAGAYMALGLSAAQDTQPPFQVVGDGIPQPLAAAPGDAERGHALLVERAAANCLLCHAVPDPKIRVSGNVGPSLAGIGAKLTAAQIRLRIADIQRVSPEAAMPSYYRVAGLDRVAAEYRAKPVLDAGQIEDLVAYLQTLK